MNLKAIALLLAVAALGLMALAVTSTDAQQPPALLSDFETEEELSQWQEISSELSRQAEMGVTSGSLAGRIRFQPNKQTSGILLRRPFDQRTVPRDWSEYGALAIDIVNPGDAGRIIVRIRDSGGKTFTKKVEMKKRSDDQLVVYLEEMMIDIDVSRVSQIQLYFWNLEEPYDLYIDKVRLTAPSREPGQPTILREEHLIGARERTAAARSATEFAENRTAWSARGNEVVRVPLTLGNDSGIRLQQLTVSGGVPFPAGELRPGDDIRLSSTAGEGIPVQSRTLGLWTDGSIKWLEVIAPVVLTGNRREAFVLEYGAVGGATPPDLAVALKENAAVVLVDTGPLQLEIGRKGFGLFDRVWLDQNGDGEFGAAELVSQGSDMVVVFDGKEFRSSLDLDYALTIEQRGPLRVVLRAEGWFVAADGDRFCRFVVRIRADAGADFLGVDHTFIYTGYPENAEFFLYRGKPLPENEAPEAIRIDTDLALAAPVRWRFGADGLDTESPAGEFSLVQDSAGSFELRATDQTGASGQRLDGWIDGRSTRRGITVALQKMWQQHPKGWTVESDGRTLRTHLWPAEAGPLDLRTTATARGDGAAGRGSAFGLAKTHRLAYRFRHGDGSGELSGSTTAAWAAPPWLRAEPSWVAASLAAGRLRAYDPELAESLERAAERLFDWAARQVQDFEWYGMIDFGDTLSWYREKDGRSGWFPDGRWGWLNNEAMGLHSGALLQYLRTDQAKYLDFGESVAMHIMDVDTVHYNTVANDERLRGVIPDDFSRVGSQHRHNADHWGGRNEETSHTNLHGILLYYYMTGYQRAFDVALEIGEFLLEGRVTYFGHPDNCPQRNIANVLWGLSELYEATGDSRYKSAADSWAGVLVRGQTEEGTWLEKYNPLSREWRGKPKSIFTLQYTLPALITYHRVTGNEAVADAIVRATDYYIRERPYNPYFDALSYSFDLTQDPRYRKATRAGVKYMLSKQRRGGGPMIDGMIFSKATFLRPVEFLYQIPFAFEAMHGTADRSE